MSARSRRGASALAVLGLAATGLGCGLLQDEQPEPRRQAAPQAVAQTSNEAPAAARDRAVAGQDGEFDPAAIYL